MKEIPECPKEWMENVFGMLLLDTLGQIQVGTKKGEDLHLLRQYFLLRLSLSHSSKAFGQSRYNILVVVPY